MTFLNPLFLIGLAAAVIPFILHFLNLRKLKTIEFSSLAFLKELQQTKIRRLKLKQLLLLIVRTLLIIFIVLAFARPAVRSTFLGSIGSNAHSTIVILLDDSFSMARRDEGGDYFSQAKQAALEIVNILKDGDDAYLIKLSDLPEATIDPSTHDFKLIRSHLSRAKISEVTRPIDDGIRLSFRLLSGSVNANKEIYIITDNQATLYPRHIMKERLSVAEGGMKIILVPVGTSDDENRSVDSVEVKSTIIEIGKPVRIKTTVSNFGNRASPNLLASVYLEGKRVAQKNLSLDPFGQADAEFSVVPGRSGYNDCSIQIEDDPLMDDNQRYFSIFAPQAAKIIFTARSGDDLRLPMLAVSSKDPAGLDGPAPFKFTAHDKFALENIFDFDLAVVSGIQSLPENQLARIRDFVSGGGSLIIFPDDQIDIQSFNKNISKYFNISTLHEIVGSDMLKANLTFSFVDLDNPLFEGMFLKDLTDLKSRNIDPPSIYKSLQIQPDPGANNIIMISGNMPFLTEHRLDRGRIFLFSVAPGLTWSDFPLKGIFAPLMNRIAAYSSSRQDDHNFLTGDSPLIKIRSRSDNEPGESGGGVYRLTLPDGVQEPVQPVSDNRAGTRRSGDKELKLRSLERPGIYQLLSQKVTVAKFPVNVNRLESDTREISKDKLDGYFDQFHIRPVILDKSTLPSGRFEQIYSARFGTEFWKHSIVIALILALLEMIIARDNRKSMDELGRDR